MSNRTIFTAAEAAKYAGKSSSTIIRWCKKDGLPHKIVGIDNRYLITKTALDKHLKSKTKRAPNGFMLLTSAVAQTGISESNITRMIERGDLESKKVKNRRYVHKSQMMKIAETYDPEQARIDNGKRTAEKIAVKRKAPKPKENATTRAIKKHLLAHAQTMAEIENIRRDARERVA